MTPQQRERIQRMEQVGLMAAGSSHDFNNTAQCVLAEVAAVEARLRDLRKLLMAAADPAVTASAARLLAECHGSLGIIDTGLQTAVASNREVQRMYRGEQSVTSPAGTDLRRAAERALRLVSGRLRPLAELRNGDKIRVAVSEDTLVRVLLNLLINASDAFPPGAREPRVQVNLQFAGDRANCDVIDNGPGVPVEILPRLFEPFTTTKPLGAGSGLGLAVSRQLVRAAGGELRLLETGSSGTAFRLTLPVVAATETSGDDTPDAAHFFAATLRDAPKNEGAPAGEARRQRRTAGLLQP
jgi:C4-dicarboxylate-specific signal transduction histidine kinase